MVSYDVELTLSESLLCSYFCRFGLREILLFVQTARVHAKELPSRLVSQLGPEGILTAVTILAHVGKNSIRD